MFLGLLGFLGFLVFLLEFCVNQLNISFLEYFICRELTGGNNQVKSCVFTAVTRCQKLESSRCKNNLRKRRTVVIQIDLLISRDGAI